jgi:hypothetical protein
MDTKVPLVSINFSFHGNKVNEIHSVNREVDINLVSESALSNNNTSHEYSGRHDHGSLPQLKSSGPIAEVIASMLEAKRSCDRYLTECINREYGYGEANIKTEREIGEEGPDLEREEVEEDVDMLAKNQSKKMRIEKES